MGEENKAIRQKVLKLIAIKEALEHEITELNKILVANNVGMDDPLVDSEGFPLAHIDIYQVRHARHLIICKQNDYQKLLQQIEAGVAQYYNLPGVVSQAPSEVSEDLTAPSKFISEHQKPFARINIVHPGSPADRAGIKPYDLLIAFGSINASNYRGLEDIGIVIQHSKGNAVIAIIKRNEQFHHIRVLPREWDGQGLLGCNVLPM